MKWVKSGPKRPMPEIPDQARKILQRVGLTLVVFGLLDISLMIYCLARAAIPTLRVASISSPSSRVLIFGEAIRGT